jgi:hypothetical protein
MGASALYSLALVRAGGPPPTALLALYPMGALGVAVLFPNTFPFAVIAVLFCSSALWQAYPMETSLWVAGSVMVGLIAGLLLMNLQRKGLRASSATAGWINLARAFLTVGGLVNAVLAYVLLQMPMKSDQRQLELPVDDNYSCRSSPGKFDLVG